MGLSIDYPITQRYATFINFPGVFTPVECRQIIKLGKELGFNQSLVLDDTDPSNTIGIPSTDRTSSSAWLPSREHPWIVERLLEIAHAANADYQFDIDTFDDMLQITRYEKGQQYKWHIDNGTGQMAKRKLTLVLHLSEEFEFENGGLQFFNNRSPVDQRIGSVTAFPAFEVHRARPVSSGTRYSLVTWINGRPFR